jgi:N-acetyl-gamma-glutamyl-phosphate reductase
VPHGAAKELASKLTCKVIDLTADHRSTHTYGLPEVFTSEIKNANLVANPGCYATACLLASLPVKDKIDSIVFDCISGYSGGGKTSKYDYEENIIAYSLVNHFHKNEIQDKLGMKVSFTPHVVNAFNGLMCTAHITLKNEMSKDELMVLYYEKYASTLTQLSETIPCTKDVLNTPFCKISFEVSGKELVVVSVLDNLMKGAASQAIQNMNLIFGLNQSEGLV